MSNSIKGRNSKEVTIQLKRAVIQKNILIKNIYKEYEAYFNIVRKSIITSTKKGITDIYSNFSNSDKALHSKELNIFLNKNISLLINSKLPFITIEQLKLADISDPIKQLVNVKALKEFVKPKEYQTVNIDYENDSDNEYKGKIFPAKLKDSSFVFKISICGSTKFFPYSDNLTLPDIANLVPGTYRDF